MIRETTRQLTPNEAFNQAAKDFNLEAMQAQLNNGANQNAVICGDTALTAAVSNFNRSKKPIREKVMIVKKIIAYLHPEVIRYRGRTGKTALHLASEAHFPAQLLLFICTQQINMTRPEEPVDFTLIDTLIVKQHTQTLRSLFPIFSLTQLHQICQYIRPLGELTDDVDLHSLYSHLKQDITHRILPTALNTNTLSETQLHIARNYSQTMFQLLIQILSHDFVDTFFYYGFLAKRSTLSWLNHALDSSSAINKIIHHQPSLSVIKLGKRKPFYQTTLEKLIKKEHEAFGHGIELEPLPRKTHNRLAHHRGL